jgi:histidinol-phosphate aminotransferase
MFDPDKIVRDNVRRLIPYSCARDDFQGKEGVFLDANENPFGKLNRYPDPYQKELKEVISRLKGIPVGKIFLGNGSDEIIDLCFRIFCKPSSELSLTFTPTYGMYQVAASVNDVEMVKIPLDENFMIRYSDVEPWLSDKKLKLIIICSPNNPTGNSMDRTVIEKICSNFGGIVLLDEAYIDFTGRQSMKESINKHGNLIVMQTFSKAFGMASLRVGIAFASPLIIRYFNKMKPPYNISSINQEKALRQLLKPGIPGKDVERIIKERKRLSSGLEKLQVVERVFPSDANFLLVRVKDAGYIYNYLVKNKIITRNRSSLIKNCLRITVGKKSENDMLLRALETLKP